MENDLHKVVGAGDCGKLPPIPRGAAEHQESMATWYLGQKHQAEQFEHMMSDQWKMHKEKVDMQQDR